VAPSAALIGIAFSRLVSSRLTTLWRSFPLAMVAVGILAILSTFRTYAFDIYRVPKKHAFVLQAAEKIRQLVPSDSRIITTSHNSAVFQYYADRQGKYLVIRDEDKDNLDNQTIQQFDEFREAGAEYYAIADASELGDNLAFAEYLEQFELLNPEDKDNFRIYKL
jgi:hypothetical protein